MTYETPEQYELRTMPEAFGGCAKGGGDSWKRYQEILQRAKEKREHWERMENDPEYRRREEEFVKDMQERESYNYHY
jgi:hypothetical protein